VLDFEALTSHSHDPSVIVAPSNPIVTGVVSSSCSSTIVCLIFYLYWTVARQLHQYNTHKALELLRQSLLLGLRMLLLFEAAFFHNKSHILTLKEFRNAQITASNLWKTSNRAQIFLAS